MKRFSQICFLGIVAFPLLAAACGGKSDDPVDPNLSTKATVNVSPESLSPDFNAQSLELTVSANVDWAIRSDASWLSFRPTGGLKNQTTTVKVEVTANKDFDSRTAVINIVSNNNTLKQVNIVQGFEMSASSSINSMILSGESSSREFTITSNGNWNLVSEADWLSISPTSGDKGETNVTVKAQANEGETSREANILLTCGNKTSTISVTQLNYNITAPQGYHLVWNDEFSDDKLSDDWTFEVQNSGWVNNELQNYVNRKVDGKSVAEVKDGFLNINCFKGSDGKIYSGRIYAKVKEGWTYGYFEAKINLPSGKGTWPAFWMMPVHFTSWPHDGEMDIMEEVGVDANIVSSSLHADGHVHSNNTQITANKKLSNPPAEGHFHTYAMEWTPDWIQTYVDGEKLLYYANDGKGDRNWPYHTPFYLILNLAWGGDWGGYAGVDESALPVTMQVDYVRVFQKN